MKFEITEYLKQSPDYFKAIDLAIDIHNNNLSKKLGDCICNESNEKPLRDICIDDIEFKID